MNTASSNSQFCIAIFLMFKPSDCKDIGIRELEFEESVQFFSLHVFWIFRVEHIYRNMFGILDS